MEGEVIREAAKRLPKRVKTAIRRVLGGNLPLVGRVQLGDLARTDPISKQFGYDRGTPIDRLYIDEFLAARSQDIRGRVLEVGEAMYSQKFGLDVNRQDVLHVREHPDATIVGDLSEGDVLPEATFDCIILTQTLHLIYDMPTAVRELKKALRPGGVALVTVPGVSSVDHGEWGGSWYWSLTPKSVKRLFGEVFGSSNVKVEAFGNVYAATCFLHGLAVEEVQRDWLDTVDPAYPVTVVVSARRQALTAAAT